MLPHILALDVLYDLFGISNLDFAPYSISIDSSLFHD